MKTQGWHLRIAIIIAILAALMLPTTVVLAQGSIIPNSVVAEPFGTYNGIDYTKYTGRFAGTADYDVPFEIVAPADPSAGNHTLVLEPYHVMGASAGRDGYLTNDLLFGEGFTYAGLRWHPEDVNPGDGYDAEEAVEILRNFTLMLRESAEAQEMVGDLEAVYGLGVSMTTRPLLDVLASPSQTMLDFTFLAVPTLAGGTFEPPADAGPIMVLLTEADLVRSALMNLQTQELRGSAPNYRCYEIAGAPHIPDTPWVREVGPAYGLFSEDTTPLDWTPVSRALFLAGHRWASEGVEPPAVTPLADAPAGQLDAVYKEMFGLDLRTGILRDTNGNALGGIRLPDLAHCRGTYIAVDPESPMYLLGTWLDPQYGECFDPSACFEDEEPYLTCYRTQANTLMTQNLLTESDADRMLAAATGPTAEVLAAAFTPAISVLPETGDANAAIWIIVSGLLLIAFSLAMRRSQFVRTPGNKQRK